MRTQKGGWRENLSPVSHQGTGQRQEAPVKSYKIIFEKRLKYKKKTGSKRFFFYYKGGGRLSSVLWLHNTGGSSKYMSVYLQTGPKRARALTIACSILLSMATTPMPEELQNRRGEKKTIFTKDFGGEWLMQHCGFAIYMLHF